MGERTVRIRTSDLSGRDFEPDDQVVRVVVLEHPALDGGQAVQLDVTPGEIASAVDAALSVAVFEVDDGSGQPRRFVVDVGDFDALAADTPMAALLKHAPTIKASKRTEKPTV